MHPQLEILLEIQDLRAQKRALEEEGVREMESEVFEVVPEEAVAKIEEKIHELEDRLEPPAASRYRRIGGHEGRRVVVPVMDGVCYGCFMRVPTAWASDAERNEALESCDNCGRFLYHVD
jgi:predicted  nucleic acid-binding Zn-ribbon protein